MPTSFVDQKARDMASKALNAINTHERVCAERWNEARGVWQDIKRILAWGASALVGAMGAIIVLLLTHPG